MAWDAEMRRFISSMQETLRRPAGGGKIEGAQFTGAWLDELTDYSEEPVEIAQVFRRRVRGSEGFVIVRQGRTPVTFHSLADFLGVLRTRGYRSVSAKATPAARVRCACSGRCSEGRADYVIEALPPAA